MSKEAVLGIDTSNYTTSAAAVDSSGNIISDRRIMLKVKDGEKGLRQQEALFQHVMNMPEVIGAVMDDIKGYDLAGVSCSVRPRPVDGSYMPVFNSGYSFAETISKVKGIGLFTFSHQEGHVRAAAHDTSLEGRDDFVFFHLSGGTTEAVTLPGYELTGKTLDISFGQLIDRAGVLMGLGFPCGKEMDKAACSYQGSDLVKLPKIKVKDAEVNLSGIDTHIKRYLESEKDPDLEKMSKSIFDSCADALFRMTKDINEKTGKRDFLFAGGVSSSIYIRKRLEELINDSGLGITTVFGKPELCRDNAVGTALLGGQKVWH